jgi:hypothetical protein
MNEKCSKLCLGCPKSVIILVVINILLFKGQKPIGMEEVWVLGMC